jgi:spore cortex formation protein SpoVR/YcgB (stage V sporulation)
MAIEVIHIIGLGSDHLRVCICVCVSRRYRRLSNAGRGSVSDWGAYSEEHTLDNSTTIMSSSEQRSANETKRQTQHRRVREEGVSAQSRQVSKDKDITDRATNTEAVSQ